MPANTHNFIMRTVPWLAVAVLGMFAVRQLAARRAEPPSQDISMEAASTPAQRKAAIARLTAADEGASMEPRGNVALGGCALDEAGVPVVERASLKDANAWLNRQKDGRAEANARESTSAIKLAESAIERAEEMARERQVATERADQIATQLAAMRRKAERAAAVRDAQQAALDARRSQHADMQSRLDTQAEQIRKAQSQIATVVRSGVPDLSPKEQTDAKPECATKPEAAPTSSKPVLTEPAVALKRITGSDAAARAPAVMALAAQASSLTEAQRTEIVSEMVAALGSDNEDTVAAAARVLGHLRACSAHFHPLLAVLQNHTGAAQTAAAYAISRSTVPLDPTLLRGPCLTLLKSTDTDARVAGAMLGRRILRDFAFSPHADAPVRAAQIAAMQRTLATR